MMQLNKKIKSDSELSWRELQKIKKNVEYLNVHELEKKISNDYKDLFEKSSINNIVNPQEYYIDLRTEKLKKIFKNFESKNLDLKKLVQDSERLYFFMSYLKCIGDITYPDDDRPVRRHIFRMNKFLEDLRGDILDVGCNSTNKSMLLFSEKVKYVGCDPFLSKINGSMISCYAEYLPFKDSSFDGIIFNTSLDHIFDYHEALLQAHRIGRPNSTLVISGYAWDYDATLLKDHVHFHHFREDQLVAAIKPIAEIDEILRYECPKENKHRFAIYIKASIKK